MWVQELSVFSHLKSSQGMIKTILLPVPFELP